MKSIATALFFILFVATQAQAQIVRLQRITVVDGGTLDAAIDAALVDVQADINKDLPAGKPKRLMEGMANSQAASAKGLATDYISHFETFTVGAGVGLGADLEKDESIDSELSGAGITAGAQIGLNISALTSNKVLGLDPKRLTAMVNFFKYDMDREVDDNKIGADMLSFGITGSYKWIPGSGNRWWGWDGVRLHTGYQYSKLDLSINTTVNEAVGATLASNDVITGTVTGTPKAEIKTSTHSIPIEISSGVNFLYVLSFYGGLGTDLNMGTAKGSGGTDTTDNTLNCDGGSACTNDSIVVRTSANVNENGKVNPLFFRAFAGFQFNVPFVNIYAQANKLFGTEIYSFATGLRLVF